MKRTFQIDRKGIDNALKDIVKAIPTRVDDEELLPLLNPLITIHELTMTIGGSDGQTTMEIDVPLMGNDSPDPYSFTVGKKQFKDLIKNFMHDTLTFVFDDFDGIYKNCDLYIKHGKDQIVITADNGKGYPVKIQKEDDAKLLELKPDDLKAILKEVYYASSERDSRNALMGINLSSTDAMIEKNNKGKWIRTIEPTGQKPYLIVQATDAYRMAVKEFKEIEASNLDVTIPKKMIKLSPIFKDKTIEVRKDDQHVYFIGKNKRLIGKIYEEPFPNTIAIFQPSYPIEIKTKAKELIEKINFGVKMTKSGAISHCKMVLDNEARDLTLNYQNRTDKWTSELHLNQFENKGDDIQIFFNAGFMLDALNSLEPDQEIVLSMVNKNKTIKITNPDKSDVSALIVPLRSF